MESRAALVVGHSDHGRLILLKQPRKHLGVDIAARQRFLVGDYVECCLPKSVLASERSKTELWFIIARPLAAARYIRSMSLR